MFGGFDIGCVIILGLVEIYLRGYIEFTFFTVVFSVAGILR